MVRLKGFEKLIKVDDALDLFLSQLEPKPIGIERVPLQNALRRVNSEDIKAKYNLPLFDRSAVDGYALKAKDTFGVTEFRPKIFNLTENEVSENEARELWTGNAVPEGADAVVMLEYTKKFENEIEVATSVTPGRNVSKSGEDVLKGKVAINAGTRLNPYHLSLLAALGETDICVFKKPRVAILPTGNELIELGNKLEHGKIVESNSLLFSGLCNELGVESLNLGLVKDDLKEIVSKIEEGLKQADSVITTGGTSVGYPDFVPMAVDKIGKPGIIVHGIAIRPGMPTALGILKNKPIFVLSGNPVAATVGFEAFARPTLLKMVGVKETRPIVEAKLTRRVTGILGRRVFLRVLVFERDDNFLAEPVRITGSGILTTMTKANGYVIIPENREGIEEGELVKVQLFGNIVRE